MKHKSPVHSAFRLLPSALVLLILAGCEGNHLVQSDPFFGTQSAPRPVASAGDGAAAQTGGTGIPPVPGSTSAPSLAPLASGTTQAPEDPRHMRIDAPPSVVPVSSPAGAARGVAPGNVQVDGPVPIPDSTSNRAPVPIAQGGLQQTAAAGGGAIPAAPAAGNMTFEQVQQALKQRGVVWQRLETWGDQGQWKFTCSRPIPGRTNINTTYESKAPDPLSAVRAAIKKIEEDQR